MGGFLSGFFVGLRNVDGINLNISHLLFADGTLIFYEPEPIPPSPPRQSFVMLILMF
jgi:hypothetical protein